MVFLTTPIKNHSKNEINSQCIIHSPPILKSDEEQPSVNGDEPNNNSSNSLETDNFDEKINNDERNVSQIEGHPHGLSARKKTVKEYSIYEDENQTDNNDYDKSIELGRNKTDIKSDSPQSSSSDYDSNPNIQNELNVANSVDRTNNSIKMEDVEKEIPTMTTPSNKRDGEVFVRNDIAESSKKIKLDNTPDLHIEKENNSLDTNSDRSIMNSTNDLDQHIENPFEVTSSIQGKLVETKTNVINTNEDNKNIGDLKKENGTLDDPFDESHKLTPIAPRSVSNYAIPENDLEIDSITKRNDELNDQIFSLNQRINSMHAIHEKLKEELKQLKFTNNILNEEKQKLQDQMQNYHERLQNENENVKCDLNNLKSEVSSLQSNQTLLQKKYDQICNENIKLQNAKDILSDEISTLQKNLSDSADILENLSSHNKDLETKLNQLTNSKVTIEKERNELNKELRRIITQLDGKDNEISTLEGKVRELIENEKNYSKDLIDQIAKLSNEKMSLEEKIKKEENSHKTEIQYLKDTIDEKEQQLININKQINKIKEEKTKMEEKLKDKNNELDSMKRNVEETNDNVTIKAAEVSELNKEIKKLKEDKLQSEVNISKLEEQVQELGNKYKEEVERKRQLHIELENLQEKVSKETTVSANNTSAIDLTEYQKFKEENEKLKRDQENHALLSSSSTASSTLEMYKKQIENLKHKLEQRDVDTTKRLRKLSEDLYIQYSSKHKQKIKLLKKNYETKFKGEIERLTQENIALQQEAEQLNDKLSIGRREKQELLKALENK